MYLWVPFPYSPLHPLLLNTLCLSVDSDILCGRQLGQFNQLAIFWHSSQQEVGSVSPLLTSGWLWPTEHPESCWLASEAGSKRPCSFLLAHWNACPLSPEPACHDSDYPKTAKFGRTRVGTLVDSPSWACPSPIPGQVPDIWLKKPYWKWILLTLYSSHTSWVTSQPVESSSLRPQPPLSRNESSLCVLLKFLTPRMGQHNSMFVVLCSALYFRVTGLPQWLRW